MSIKFIGASYSPGAQIGINERVSEFFYHKEPQYLVTYLNLSTGKQVTKDCYNELNEYVKKNFETNSITPEILNKIEEQMKSGKIPFKLY